VETYAERFSGDLARIDAGHGPALERLRAFARLYRQGLAADQGCLCGVLASEVAVLPARVQAVVRQFFQLNLRWLERTLQDGLAKGQLGGNVEPRRDARTVLATLQGATLVALSLQQPASFDHAVDGLLAGLSAQARR
jgi:TetR/AcrR family transcriptional repressor of nem operon